MSSTPATQRVPADARPGMSLSCPPPPGSGGPAGPQRRVRHQAQEALAVMAFSGLLSVGFALALLLLTHLGR